MTESIIHEKTHNPWKTNDPWKNRASIKTKQRIHETKKQQSNPKPIIHPKTDNPWQNQQPMKTKTIINKTQIINEITERACTNTYNTRETYNPWNNRYPVKKNKHSVAKTYHRWKNNNHGNNVRSQATQKQKQLILETIQYSMQKRYPWTKQSLI